MATIIPDLTHLPIVANSLYAFDIDNTLTEVIYTDISEKTWRRQSTHRDNEIILNKISKISRVIYITARHPDGRENTLHELRFFKFPKGKVFFELNKNETLKSYINSSKKKYDSVFFVDDNRINAGDMIKHMPSVKTFQLDPLHHQIKIKKNMFYVYYESSGIVSEKGFYKNGVKHGKWYYNRKIGYSFYDILVQCYGTPMETIIRTLRPYARYSAIITYKNGVPGEIADLTELPPLY